MLKPEHDTEAERVQKIGGEPVGLMANLSPEEYVAVSFFTSLVRRSRF